MAQTSPLDGRELAYLHEMVGSSDYTLSDVSDLASLLSDDRLDLIRQDISLWEDGRGKNTVIGGDVSIDPERLRRLIRRRSREALGIAGASSGLFTISVGGR